MVGRFASLRRGSRWAQGWALEGASAARHGRFVELMPKERVVELLEFEMADPTMRGEMRITFLLFETEDGTEHDARHEDVPAGIVATDHEAGWRMSLARLKRLVERTRP